MKNHYLQTAALILAVDRMIDVYDFHYNQKEKNYLKGLDASKITDAVAISSLNKENNHRSYIGIKSEEALCLNFVHSGDTYKATLSLSILLNKTTHVENFNNFFHGLNKRRRNEEELHSLLIYIPHIYRAILKERYGYCEKDNLHYFKQTIENLVFQLAVSLEKKE